VQISGSQWRALKKLQQWLQPQLPPAASLQARLLIEQISQLQQHIHRIEDEIEKQIPFEASAERLMAVPGLGKVGGWTILAEIGDIHRFPSAKQFVPDFSGPAGTRGEGQWREPKAQIRQQRW
jgi:transposase